MLSWNEADGQIDACPDFGGVLALVPMAMHWLYFPSFLWVRCEGKQGLLIDHSSFKRHLTCKHTF
jgi:hypothetical protein